VNDIIAVLHGVRGQPNQRFPFVTSPSPLPVFMADPQLLRFVHKNAISNACKYGKRGGPVTTDISFKDNEITMNVTNLPGPYHEALVRMGNSARKAVFEPGNRLHPDLGEGQDLASLNQSQTHSSGDGGWIIKKCATALGGDCSIKFHESRTVFTLRCPAKFERKMSIGNQSDSEYLDASDFCIPSNTWGIGIDDSRVQRKLLAKMLCLCGIHEDKTRVLGKSNQEIMEFENIMLTTVRENPEDFVFVIVDENLDIDGDGTLLTVSGSHSVERVRKLLNSEEEARLLCLVRSANDSRDDLALYSSRAHGYIPKGPVLKRDSLLQLIAPCWIERFGV